MHHSFSSPQTASDENAEGKSTSKQEVVGDHVKRRVRGRRASLVKNIGLYGYDAVGGFMGIRGHLTSHCYGWEYCGRQWRCLLSSKHPDKTSHDVVDIPSSTKSILWIGR